MIIDIVRHAETFSNAEGRLQGSEDLLLSKRGLEQAEQLVEFLDPIYDKIICSSMKRSRQTLALALGKSIEESLDRSKIRLVLTIIIIFFFAQTIQSNADDGGTIDTTTDISISQPLIEGQTVDIDRFTK